MASSEDKTNYGYDQPSVPEPYPVQQQPPGYGPPSMGYGQRPVIPQPASHSTTVINTGQPRPLAAPQNIREWTTGIFGCFNDIGSACFSCWCFPCFMCNLSQRLGESCCGPCCCGCVHNTILRNKFRTMYGIRGSICGDITTMACCEMCAMCQLSRELDSMETRQNGLNLSSGNVQIMTHNQY